MLDYLEKRWCAECGEDRTLDQGHGPCIFCGSRIFTDERPDLGKPTGRKVQTQSEKEWLSHSRERWGKK